MSAEIVELKGYPKLEASIKNPLQKEITFLVVGKFPEEIRVGEFKERMREKNKQFLLDYMAPIGKLIDGETEFAKTYPEKFQELRDTINICSQTNNYGKAALMIIGILGIDMSEDNPYRVKIL